jgi:hypothetical protein
MDKGGSFMWDLGNLALAVAALVGLLIMMIQFGFDIVDHGSVMKPEEIRADELIAQRYKKAA